jgi:hypothetical protein
MKLGLVIGLVGSIVGSAAVAGASYISVELLRAGSFEKRMAGFQKFKEALDFEIEYKRSVGEAFSPDFALEGVTLVSDDRRIDVERVEFRRFDWSAPSQPTYSSVVLIGMKFKTDLFASVLGPEMAKVLEEAKIENVVVDAAIAHESTEEEVEDPKTKRRVKQKSVAVKQLKLEFRDLGTFTAEIELRDFEVVEKAVARKTVEMPPLVRLIGEKVRFAGAKLTFQDKGIMKVFIDARARELGKGDLQARGSLVRELQKDAQATRSAVGSNRFDSTFFVPMMQYVERYDRLTGFTLVAAPAEAIEIRRLVAMYQHNRGGFFDKFNPRVSLGAARAAPKKEEPKPR